MSKRPKTANSFLSRLRRPVGRLGDMPIWSKLGLIMIVPTIATVVVGTSGLVDHLETLNNANRVGTLAKLSEVSGVLVNDLQDERAAAVLVIGTMGSDQKAKQKYHDVYANLHPKVDQAKGPYSQQRLALTDLPPNFTSLLNRIDQSLADLPATRSQVFNGKLKINEAAQSYEALISDLLDMRDSAAQLATDTTLSERMRAAAAVARVKEFLSMRRVVVHRAFLQDDGLTQAIRTDYIATEQGQQQALQSFKAVATRAESELYDQTVSGPDWLEADNYSGWVRSSNSVKIEDAPFTADKWDAAMISNAKLIRTVESNLDAGVVDHADQLRAGTQRQVFLETGLLLTMLLLAVLFAWLVARSMARSLRELRHGALSIAQYGLPQAVSRLRDPQLSAQMSPVQVANQLAKPLPVRSNDEFGQVTEAFNAVHLEAVRTAAEQAALRSSVATMFVNLARRSQILVDRLIGHLDRLERGEEDPDRLAELFQLDHLATRMRRNDENLLVLAGADSTRVQREPAALIDVLRAAQSEVEHYTRIEFGVVDRDLEVSAPAVNDLVHLVAELFDNATAFSPPDSQVLVEARRVGDRASLYVEDRGIGINGEQLSELNERLATPPMVDVAVSRMMGLVVVARLAARHGVKVELRPGSDRGTVADVTLPTSVLVPRALTGRVHQPNAFPTSAQQQPSAQQPPTQRPPFGAPLALESGPAAPLPDERARPLAGPGGRSFDPTSFNGGSSPKPAGPGRPMPAWSDLTGATTRLNGTSAFTPTSANGGGADPLPQRRATVDGEATDQPPGPNIPRQVPFSPEARPDPAGLAGHQLPPASVPPAASEPPRAVPPVPSAGAPPVWPPASTPDGDAATPPVPERLSAALDMTTDAPHGVRNPEPPVLPRPAAVDSRAQYADETMELPIFRELESAWFRTRRPAAEEGNTAAVPPTYPGQHPAPDAQPSNPAAVNAPTAQFAIVDVTRPGASTTPGPAGVAPSAGTPAPTAPAPGVDHPDAAQGAPAGHPGGAPSWHGDMSGGWQTAADDGWRAASAASDVPVGETTDKGLPKRMPMAQLVPGGVERPATSVLRRTPESVRGLLSAYHRGVQRGRTHPTDDHSTNPEATPGGQQSSQPGAGPASESGQKEHEG